MPEPRRQAGEARAPRVVTPQEAQQGVALQNQSWARANAMDLAHTVATEPERTRAAVIKALRAQALRIRTAASRVHRETLRGLHHAETGHAIADSLDEYADAIENGALL